MKDAFKEEKEDIVLEKRKDTSFAMGGVKIIDQHHEQTEKQADNWHKDWAEKTKYKGGERNGQAKDRENGQQNDGTAKALDKVVPKHIKRA